MSRWNSQYLFQPIDNSPLVFFRIGFGLLILAEAWGAIATGWVRRAFVDPQVTFPFIGFEWLREIHGPGMYAYFGIMGIAGLMVMLGWRYRIGIILYAVLWSFAYLGQKTNYNNHYYLLMLLCMVMAMMPAHQYYSLDARRNPNIRSLTCPRWCIWAFLVQLTIVYVYASIAKMYPAWLVAKPVSMWFGARADWPIIGPLLAASWVHWVVSYGGILFDLLIAPALLWRKTRMWAFGIAIFFHLFNSLVFHIGIFPYLGILLCVFFFPPEEVRRLFMKIRLRLAQVHIKMMEKPAPDLAALSPYPTRKLLVYFFAVWFVIQIGLPLRHWTYAGNANWTEEGHRLAWHMMLRVKQGYVKFVVKDHRTGKSTTIPSKKYLTRKQSRVVATRPDMCWQFVQYLKADLAKNGQDSVAIYAKGKVSLNGAPYAPLYDPNADLTTKDWHRFKAADWLIREETKTE